MRELERIIATIESPTRAKIIGALEAEASEAERVAGSIRRRTGPEAEKKRAARAHVERIGRILHFLHHQTPAFSATKEDEELCNLIVARLWAHGNQ